MLTLVSVGRLRHRLRIIDEILAVWSGGGFYFSCGVLAATVSGSESKAQPTMILTVEGSFFVIRSPVLGR